MKLSFDDEKSFIEATESICSGNPLNDLDKLQQMESSDGLSIPAEENEDT